MVGLRSTATKQTKSEQTEEAQWPAFVGRSRGRRGAENAGAFDENTIGFAGLRFFCAETCTTIGVREASDALE